MSVITEYVVVKCSSVGELEQAVSSKLRYDWQPIGGVLMACDKNTDYFLQAMVKYQITKTTGKTK